MGYGLAIDVLLAKERRAAGEDFERRVRGSAGEVTVRGRLRPKAMNFRVPPAAVMQTAAAAATCAGGTLLPL
jgi:hypothetical protein